MSYLDNRILGEIDAKEIKIGRGVIVEEGVKITGTNGPAEKVILGDFCYIGAHTKIFCPEFRLGDYSKLHTHSYGHGYQPLRIGRNCWIGSHTVLDSIGGLDIDDNVGIGSYSQIWTHIRFGDVVEGCRFNQSKYMHIGKDAWFVGHCLVSPVTVEEKSMAMLGSVVTRDMLFNRVYAGVPAKDISDKVGCQFSDIDVDKKHEALHIMLQDFFAQYPRYRDQIKIIRRESETIANICCINISNRTYQKTLSEAEVTFFKNNVPLIKFTPSGEGSFIFDTQA
jgi:acetyltransferase-like isoleucine patch superfamily enzyme